MGAGRNARLIGWSLEGSAITVAPPRAGKGAVIALNLLSPDYRGFDGSTVTIDPRGELWCIAARRRRELGRRVLLLDPFGVAAKHKEDFPECHLPDTTSARFNPLSFIREDEGLAVRDINVLLDALLTAPRPGAHDSVVTSTNPPGDLAGYAVVETRSREGTEEAFWARMEARREGWALTMLRAAYVLKSDRGRRLAVLRGDGDGATGRQGVKTVPIMDRMLRRNAAGPAEARMSGGCREGD